MQHPNKASLTTAALLLLSVMALSSCSGSGIDHSKLPSFMGFLFYADAYYAGYLSYIAWAFPIIAVADIVYLVFHHAWKMVAFCICGNAVMLLSMFTSPVFCLPLIPAYYITMAMFLFNIPGSTLQNTSIVTAFVCELFVAYQGIRIDGFFGGIWDAVYWGFLSLWAWVLFLLDIILARCDSCGRFMKSPHNIGRTYLAANDVLKAPLDRRGRSTFDEGSIAKNDKYNPDKKNSGIGYGNRCFWCTD